MERTKEIQSGVKKALAAMFLAAALLSTGCGQNALLNPTADQVQAGSSEFNAASTDVNPAGQVKTSASTDVNP